MVSLEGFRVGSSRGLSGVPGRNLNLHFMCYCLSGCTNFGYCQTTLSGTSVSAWGGRDPPVTRLRGQIANRGVFTRRSQMTKTCVSDLAQGAGPGGVPAPPGYPNTHAQQGGLAFPENEVGDELGNTFAFTKISSAPPGQDVPSELGTTPCNLKSGTAGSAASTTM